MLTKTWYILMTTFLLAACQQQDIRVQTATDCLEGIIIILFPLIAES